MNFEINHENLLSNPLQKIALDLENLDTQYAKLLWSQYTTGFDFGVQEAQDKINAYLQDKSHYRTVQEGLQKAQTAEELRQATILHNSFKSFHRSEKANALHEKIQALQNSLMDLINKHRVTVDGHELTTTEVSKIMTESPDRSLRQKVFESRLPLNRKLFDAGFIELLNLRKEFASASHATNFVALRLEEDELTEDLFLTWESECKIRKGQYAEKKKQLANQYLGVDDLRPWDYGYLKTLMCQHNRAPVDMNHFFEPMKNVFSKFGFTIEKLNLTFDIFPRKNKSEWGYNFTIKPGEDSRVLANVSGHFAGFWVLLHETAHGVHFLGLNPNEKIFNRGVSGIVAEGFANFFGNLSYSREFLSEVFKDKDIEPLYRDFQNILDLQNLQSFDGLMTTLFDQDLYYKDIRSLQDIHDLKWSLHDDLLGEKPYSSEPAWAQLIHHTGAPIYLHNYFLGDVMCENMKQTFHQKMGKKADEQPLEFGQFWREKVLSPSGRFPFLDLYEQICGTKVQIGPFLDNCFRARM